MRHVNSVWTNLRRGASVIWTRNERRALGESRGASTHDLHPKHWNPLVWGQEPKEGSAETQARPPFFHAHRLS